MKRFEYLIVDGYNFDLDGETLNSYGLDGWDVALVEPTVNGYTDERYYIYHFKRELSLFRRVKNWIARKKDAQ